MRTLALSGAAAAAIAVAGLVAACDDPVSRVPTRPSAPSVVSIDITGPNSIAPGQSVQFTATARLADGTTKIPQNVRWRSSRTSFLQVSPTGLATAGALMGEIMLTAELTVSGGLRQSTKEIVIVPDGTFRLVGLVSEAESPVTPVTGARVEVTPGALAATTDFEGRYRLYGVPGDASVRVTADGYVAQEQRLQIATHTTVNVQLPLSGPRLILNGPYFLGIDLESSCLGSSPLTADLQHRRYEAMLTSSGSSVDVVLTAPGFRLNSIGRGNRFNGRSASTGAKFTLEPFAFYYYPYYGPAGYPSVVERLANGTFLVTEATVTMTGSPALLSGVTSGWLANWDSRFPTSQFLLSSCFGSVRFTLTQR
jgi:hypothetical protein